MGRQTRPQKKRPVNSSTTSATAAVKGRDKAFQDVALVTATRKKKEYHLPKNGFLLHAAVDAADVKYPHPDIFFPGEIKFRNTFGRWTPLKKKLPPLSQLIKRDLLSQSASSVAADGSSSLRHLSREETSFLNYSQGLQDKRRESQNSIFDRQVLKEMDRQLPKDMDRTVASFDLEDEDLDIVSETLAVPMYRRVSMTQRRDSMGGRKDTMRRGSMGSMFSRQGSLRSMYSRQDSMGSIGSYGSYDPILLYQHSGDPSYESRPREDDTVASYASFESPVGRRASISSRMEAILSGAPTIRDLYGYPRADETTEELTSRWSERDMDDELARAISAPDLTDHNRESLSANGSSVGTPMSNDGASDSSTSESCHIFRNDDDPSEFSDEEYSLSADEESSLSTDPGSVTISQCTETLASRSSHSLSSVVEASPQPVKKTSVTLNAVETQDPSSHRNSDSDGSLFDEVALPDRSLPLDDESNHKSTSFTVYMEEDETAEEVLTTLTGRLALSATANIGDKRMELEASDAILSRPEVLEKPDPESDEDSSMQTSMPSRGHTASALSALLKSPPSRSQSIPVISTGDKAPDIPNRRGVSFSGLEEAEPKRMPKGMAQLPSWWLESAPVVLDVVSSNGEDKVYQSNSESTARGLNKSDVPHHPDDDHVETKTIESISSRDNNVEASATSVTRKKPSVAGTSCVALSALNLEYQEIHKEESSNEVGLNVGIAINECQDASLSDVSSATMPANETGLNVSKNETSLKSRIVEDIDEKQIPSLDVFVAKAHIAFFPEEKQVVKATSGAQTENAPSPDIIKHEMTADQSDSARSTLAVSSDLNEGLADRWAVLASMEGENMNLSLSDEHHMSSIEREGSFGKASIEDENHRHGLAERIQIGLREEAEEARRRKQQEARSVIGEAQRKSSMDTKLTSLSAITDGKDPSRERERRTGQSKTPWFHSFLLWKKHAENQFGAKKWTNDDESISSQSETVSLADNTRKPNSIQDHPRRRKSWSASSATSSGFDHEDAAGPGLRRWRSRNCGKRDTSEPVKLVANEFLENEGMPKVLVNDGYDGQHQQMRLIFAEEYDRAAGAIDVSSNPAFELENHTDDLVRDHYLESVNELDVVAESLRVVMESNKETVTQSSANGSSSTRKGHITPYESEYPVEEFINVAMNVSGPFADEKEMELPLGADQGGPQEILFNAFPMTTATECLKDDLVSPPDKVRRWKSIVSRPGKGLFRRKMQRSDENVTTKEQDKVDSPRKKKIVREVVHAQSKTPYQDKSKNLRF